MSVSYLKSEYITACGNNKKNQKTFIALSADATTYAHFLFNAFDIDRNGSIRFEDFVIGLSVLLRGSITEKLNWAFNLYDINKDGYITKEVRLRLAGPSAPSATTML